MALLGLTATSLDMEELRQRLREEIEEEIGALLVCSRKLSAGRGNPGDISSLLKIIADILLLFTDNPGLPSWESSRYSRPALRGLMKLPFREKRPEISLAIILLWAVLREIIRVPASDAVEVSRMKKWHINDMVVDFFGELGLGRPQAGDLLDLLRIMFAGVSVFKRIKTKNHLHLLVPFLRGDIARRYLRFNLYRDTLWFHRESLEMMLYWLSQAVSIDRVEKAKAAVPRVKGLVLYRASVRINAMASSASYQVEDFLKELADCRLVRRKKPSGRKKRRKDPPRPEKKKIRPPGNKNT